MPETNCTGMYSSLSACYRKNYVCNYQEASRHQRAPPLRGRRPKKQWLQPSPPLCFDDFDVSGVTSVDLFAAAFISESCFFTAAISS